MWALTVSVAVGRIRRGRFNVIASALKQRDNLVVMAEFIAAIKANIFAIVLCAMIDLRHAKAM
jgi:hypothetical protein